VTYFDPGSVESQEDFVTFLYGLAKEDTANWANVETSGFLEALAVWVEGQHELGPSWQEIAAGFLAGTGLA
jgi:hypothetical protein